jgi:hypothetical protein
LVETRTSGEEEVDMMMRKRKTNLKRWKRKRREKEEGEGGEEGGAALSTTIRTETEKRRNQTCNLSETLDLIAWSTASFWTRCWWLSQAEEGQEGSVGRRRTYGRKRGRKSLFDSAGSWLGATFWRRFYLSTTQGHLEIRTKEFEMRRNNSSEETLAKKSGANRSSEDEEPTELQ